MTETNILKPVYLLTGPQALLTEKYIEYIKSGLAKTQPDFNSTTCYADTDSIEELIGKAKTISIFKETRLYVIKNCEKLKKDEIALIENYLDSPSPDAFVVFVSTEASRPKLKKHKNLEVKIFKSVDNVENRIQQEAGLLGIKLTRRAAHGLLELIGDDLKSINNELMKLSQYYLDKDLIDDKDVHAFIKKRNREDIFQLVNSIADKNRKSALKVINELKSTNYEPLSIVSTLSWRFRQIWHLKEMQSENKDEKEIIKELKVSGGAVYYLKKQADKFSFSSLSEIISSLSALDSELKFYSQDKYNLLTRFIFQLCRV